MRGTTFTSKLEDAETGLMYFGARYYSPDLVLWKSVDPAIGRTGRRIPRLPKRLGSYSYGLLNPVATIDPDGRDALYKVDRFAATITIQVPISTSGIVDNERVSEIIRATWGSEGHPWLVRRGDTLWAVSIVAVDAEVLRDDNSIQVVPWRIGAQTVGDETKIGVKRGTDQPTGVQNNATLRDVIAHEVGHLLGLPEDYVPPDASPLGEAVEKRLGPTPEEAKRLRGASIMGDFSGNKDVNLRNIQMILDLIDFPADDEEGVKEGRIEGATKRTRHPSQLSTEERRANWPSQADPDAHPQ